MASKSYGWDVRNIAKISPKMAKKQPFSTFAKTVHTIRTKISTVERRKSQKRRKMAVFWPFLG